MKASARERRVSSRVGLFTRSVITEMTRLADETGAINLAQGFPDFPAPMEIKDAAVAAIEEDYNQYEIPFGCKELRDALSERLLRFNGITADPDRNITVTCGASEALVDTMLALTEAGDEVIVPEPFYESYVPVTAISGATAVHVRYEEPRYWFEEERLKDAFNSDTRAIIINTPNNPTGRVFTREELRLVADLCEDYDAVAIADEVYEAITYPGHDHVSLASVGDMWERTVTISSASKTYGVTGWRIGYAAAEDGITGAIRKVHEYATVCAPSPLQKAAAKALRMPESYYRSIVDGYDRKRRTLTKGLSELGFGCPDPQGSYFVFADFSQLSRSDDFEFARQLVEDAGVAAVPGSSFYSGRGAARDRVRFSFCKSDDTLEEALVRLRGALA